MPRRSCLLLTLLTVLGCVSSSQSLPLEVAWARCVLLGSEVGDRRDAVVRWTHPVRFLVVGAPVRVQRAVERAFGQLQAVLQGVQQLELEHVDGRDARVGQDGFITVFATAPRHAEELARRHGAQHPMAAADGWFTISWNPRHELIRAVVFVDPDLDEHWLRHTALEEMFQALGPSNDSARIRDSLVFEGGVATGSHTRLARVDEQVLRLLYRELEPGDTAHDIERAMRRSWRFAGP